MKKIFLSIIFSVLASLSVFAADNDRYRGFDLTFDIPASASMNSFGLLDYLKPEIVIDFTKIADEMSDDGFKVMAAVSPSITAGLNMDPGLIFEVQVGTQIYAGLGIGKGLFDFLGYGNEINKEIKIDASGYVDLFLFAQLNVGWKGKKFGLTVSPAIFSTLVHAVATDSYAKMENDTSGNFYMKFNSNIDIYSVIPVSFSPDFGQDLLANYKDLLPVLGNSVGVDLGVTFTWDAYQYLTLEGTARIPIIPSRMTKRMPISMNCDYSLGLQQFATDSLGAPNFNMTMGSVQDADYSINRPMKFSITADYYPFNGVMEYYAGLGLGFKHPFAKSIEERSVYVDYMIGIRVGFVNFLNFYVSTARTDEVFCHKLGLGLNLHILELKAGISAESTSFASSFKGAGLGAYVTASVGL